MDIECPHCQQLQLSRAPHHQHLSSYDIRDDDQALLKVRIHCATLPQHSPQRKPGTLSLQGLSMYAIPAAVQEHLQQLVSTGGLRPITRLELVSMRLYRLEVLPWRASLLQLDLTCNRICQCQLVHLYGCGALQLLYLTENLVRDLGCVVDLLARLDQLEEIDLSDNPIHMDQSMRRILFDRSHRLAIIDRFNRNGRDLEREDSESEDEEEAEEAEEAEEEDEEQKEQQSRDEEEKQQEQEQDRKRRRRQEQEQEEQLMQGYGGMRKIRNDRQQQEQEQQNSQGELRDQQEQQEGMESEEPSESAS